MIVLLNQVFSAVRSLSGELGGIALTLMKPYWTPINIFTFTVVFSWTIYLWETYLSYRQYKIYKSFSNLPQEISNVMDQETFSKARLYQIDKSHFGFLANLWHQSEATIILLIGGIPYLWNICEKVTVASGFTSEHEVVQTAYFTVIGSFISTILDLPWVIYNTFVIEQRHGFNKQTYGFFIKDRTKKFILMQVVIVPIISAVVQIVKIGGDYFFIYLWVFCLLVSLILLTIYADFIAPLLDKFTPLPEGQLRSKIENLAASIGFPLKKLYVVEGSKRSAHSNAYFYGIYKNKRIVLFDTLIEDYSPFNKDISEENAEIVESEEAAEEKDKGDDKKDVKSTKKTGCNDAEVVAVLAHELGHWKLNHVLKNFVIAQVHLFSCLMVFSLLFKEEILYQAFGFYRSKPIFIGLVLIFQYIFSPYNMLLEFLMTILSRRFEFQADRFAKSLHHASHLKSALIKLNKDNLGFPVNDWLYSAWHHSHPPLLERIQALGKTD